MTITIMERVAQVSTVTVITVVTQLITIILVPIVEERKEDLVVVQQLVVECTAVVECTEVVADIAVDQVPFTLVVIAIDYTKIK